MDFTAWLNTWLARHPLRAPDELDPARYTAQVMRKLTDETPLPLPPTHWFACLRQGFGRRAWPRVAMVFATTAAGVLIVLATAHHADRRLAQRIPATPHTLMLAESTPSDDAWVQETTQLLAQLGEDSSDDNANTTSDEEWLKELQTLDEGDLNASS